MDFQINLQEKVLYLSRRIFEKTRELLSLQEKVLDNPYNSQFIMRDVKQLTKEILGLEDELDFSIDQHQNIIKDNSYCSGTSLRTRLCDALPGPRREAISISQVQRK